jgi:hypothetical protein
MNILFLILLIILVIFIGIILILRPKKDMYETDIKSYPLVDDNNKINQNWYQNYGGSSEDINEIIKCDKNNDSLTFKMCYWQSAYWYSGNLSFKEPLGFGEYSIYMRPSGGGQVLSTFYLSKPPINPGTPDPGFDDGDKEIDFEISTWPAPMNGNHYLVLPTTNIWREKRQNLDNNTKKEDNSGNCKPSSQFNHAIPLDYSVTPEPSNNYQGSLKFTIGWWADLIIWTITDQNKIVYKRVLDISKRSDKVTYYDNSSKNLSTNFSDISTQYNDPKSMVIYLSLTSFPNNINWLNCQNFNTITGNSQFNCKTNPTNGFGTIYYGPFTFSPTPRP